MDAGTHESPGRGQAPQASGESLLVLNAGARQGAGVEEVVAALAAAGVRPGQVVATDDPEALARAVREALQGGASRVIAGGGDGTLSLVANLVAGTEAAMGVLPLGTANDFARNLHLPRDLVAACEVIARGAVRRVPLGVANGRLFLNALSFGVSAAVARRLTAGLKRTAGPLAYPVAAAAEAAAPKPFRVHLAAEGPALRVDLDALQVVVGNGRYHGAGTLVAPGASLEDALLDVYVVTAAGEDAETARVRLANAWRLARLGLLLRRGRHLEHEAVQHVRCREVHLAADPPQEIDVDGELLGRTPLACSVRAGALRVFAPPRGG